MSAVELVPTPASEGTSMGARGLSVGPTQRFYRPELDALRFGAFACVYIAHAVPAIHLKGNPALDRPSGHWMQLIGETGNFGVCLFFVLSAYLITEIMRQESIAHGTLSIGRFYLRRILRIWPLYLAVVLTIAAVGLVVPALHMSKAQLAAYLLFTGNWYLVLFPGGTQVLNWLWSISVEEQFYIAWPLLARLAGTRAIMWASLVCLPASSAAVALAAHFFDHLYATVWLNSIVQFEYFGLGALMAIALAGRIPKLGRTARIILIVIGASLWCVASVFCLIKDPRANPTTLMMCSGYSLVAIGCGCLLLGVLGMEPAFIPKPLVYLGRISYGLYVFHELALEATTRIRWELLADHHDHGLTASLLYVADRICALFLTIGCAALSYKYLERPFLRINQRFAVVKTRPA
jgi:peptidoglycan/LPS O-acetylase OafA/YrhL